MLALLFRSLWRRVFGTPQERVEAGRAMSPSHVPLAAVRANQERQREPVEAKISRVHHEIRRELDFLTQSGKTSSILSFPTKPQRGNYV